MTTPWVATIRCVRFWAKSGSHCWARRLRSPLSPPTRSRCWRVAGRRWRRSVCLDRGQPFPLFVKPSLPPASNCSPRSRRRAGSHLSARQSRTRPWSIGCRRLARPHLFRHLEPLADADLDVLDECVTSGALVAAGDVAAIPTRTRSGGDRGLAARAPAPHDERGRLEGPGGARRRQRRAPGPSCRTGRGPAGGPGERTTRGEQAAHLGSHREAAAQLERALRWEALAEPAQVADWRDRLADEYGMLDQWVRSAELREDAAARWKELGDRRRESTALRKLAHAQWRLCNGAAHEVWPLNRLPCSTVSPNARSSGGRSTARRASRPRNGPATPFSRRASDRLGRTVRRHSSVVGRFEYRGMCAVVPR